MRYLLLFIFLFSSLYAIEYNPYFDYSDKKLKAIERLDSKHIVTKQSLEKWDLLLTNYLHKRPFSPGRAIRLFTYLYLAQADFAYISQKIHGEIKGSFDPVSFGLIRLFYPLFPLPKSMISDEYSIILGQLVIEKYKQRLQREEVSERELENYFSFHHLGSRNPDFGKNILGWLPWMLPPFATKFTPAPPGIDNKQVWKAQLEAVLKANKNASEKQKKIAEHWGNFFEKNGGNWIQIANDYLLSHPVDIDKAIYTRRLLTIAIYDTLIAAFEAKYTYLINPPYLEDRNILPFVDVFYYPSYPSVHAMVSYVSALILSHFFPDHTKEWIDLALEVGQSRIWAGVNYPIDVKAAIHVGKELYQRIIENGAQHLKGAPG